LLANNKWLVARFGPRVLSDVKIVHTGGVLVGAPHNDGPDAAVVCVLTVSGTRQLYHGEKKTPYLSPGKHTKLDAQLEHACTPSMGHMWIGSGATRHGTKYTSATTVSVIFRTPPDQALSRDPVEGFMWTQGQFIFPTLLQVQSAMDQVEKCQLDQARSWGLGPPRMVIDDDVDGMDDDEEAKDRGSPPPRASASPPSANTPGARPATRRTAPRTPSTPNRLPDSQLALCEQMIRKVAKAARTRWYFPPGLQSDAAGIAELLAGASPIGLGEDGYAVAPKAAKGGNFQHICGWLDKQQLHLAHEACTRMYALFEGFTESWSHDDRQGGRSRRLTLTHGNSRAHPEERANLVVDLDDMKKTPTLAPIASVFIGLEEKARRDMGVDPEEPGFRMNINWLSGFAEQHLDQHDKDGPGSKILNAHINKPSVTLFSPWDTYNSCAKVKGSCADFADAGDLTAFSGEMRTKMVHGVFQDGRDGSLNFKITQTNVHLARTSITFRAGVCTDEEVATMHDTFPEMFDDNTTQDDDDREEVGEGEVEEEEENSSDASPVRTTTPARARGGATHTHYTFEPTTPVRTTKHRKLKVSLYNAVSVSTGRRQTVRFAVGDIWRYTARGGPVVRASSYAAAYRVALVIERTGRSPDRPVRCVVVTAHALPSMKEMYAEPLIFHGAMLKRFFKARGGVLPPPCATGTPVPGPSDSDTLATVLDALDRKQYKSRHYGAAERLAKTVWDDIERFVPTGSQAAPSAPFAAESSSSSQARPSAESRAASRRAAPSAPGSQTKSTVATHGAAGAMGGAMTPFVGLGADGRSVFTAGTGVGADGRTVVGADGRPVFPGVFADGRPVFTDVNTDGRHVFTHVAPEMNKMMTMMHDSYNLLQQHGAGGRGGESPGGAAAAEVQAATLAALAEERLAAAERERQREREREREQESTRGMFQQLQTGSAFSGRSTRGRCG
jgi:hypothetical protein